MADLRHPAPVVRGPFGARSRRSRSQGLWASAEAPQLDSGVWRLALRETSRSESHVRAARARRFRSALAWCSTLLFLCGAVTLCAFTLVEIAERLVELGGTSSGRVAD